MRGKEGIGVVILLVGVVGLTLVLRVRVLRTVRVIQRLVIRIGCLRRVGVIAIIIVSPLSFIRLSTMMTTTVTACYSSDGSNTISVHSPHNMSTLPVESMALVSRRIQS